MVKLGILHSCCRKNKIQDEFNIYVERRDRKGLFTFTLHSAPSGIVDVGQAKPAWRSRAGICASFLGTCPTPEW
jgi:hypothetical protein